MNASGKFLIPDRPKTMCGPQVCDLGWNAALGLVERLIFLRGNRTTLAFLDGRSLLRRAVDPGYRDQLDRCLLLPGGGRAVGLVTKLMRWTSSPVRYSAATFILSLLTFLEGTYRIGITGEDAARIAALRDRLARHAPWHDVVAILPGEEPSCRFDLIVADARTVAEERRIERRLTTLRAALIVVAGPDLSALLPEKSTVAGSKRELASTKTALA